MQQIKINLSTESKNKRNLINSVMLILVLVVFLGGGMGYFYGKVLRELRYQEAVNLELKACNDELQKLQEIIEKQQNSEKQLKIKAENVEKLTEEAVRLSLIFEHLEATVTPDIQVVELEVSQDKVTMIGAFSRHSELVEMLALLRATDTFRNIKLVSTQEVTDSNYLFRTETIWEAPPR